MFASCSYTFTKIQERTDEVWKRQRYRLIREFQSKPPLVPPFILFAHLYRLIPYLYRYTVKKENGDFKKSRNGYSFRTYTVFQKSDAKIQITIITAYRIRIKYPLSGFNYHLSDVNVANFNKIHRTVSEQQLF